MNSTGNWRAFQRQNKQWIVREGSSQVPVAAIYKKAYDRAGTAERAHTIARDHNLMPRMLDALRLWQTWDTKCLENGETAPRQGCACDTCDLSRTGKAVLADYDAAAYREES